MEEVTIHQGCHQNFYLTGAKNNFNQAQLPLVATLVTSGESLEQAWLGHERVIENIRDYLEGAGCLEDGSGGAGLAAAPLSGG